MSQAGILAITSGMIPGNVPTLFVTNMGTAIPVANVLNVLGTTVAAGTNPFIFIGSGNTVTGEIQLTQASATSNANNVGLASFNSAQFTIDANGFVSFTGTGVTETLTGNTGTATPVANNINVITANATVKFVGAGSNVTQDFGLTNLLLGTSATSISGATQNVSLGNSSLSALVSGQHNNIIGANSGVLIDVGFDNNVLGAISLLKLTGGQGNIAIGSATLINLVTGNYNTVVGTNTGNAYASSESSNILLAALGVVGESNTLRIGKQGTGTQLQNRCFIAGIVGVTTSNSQTVTIDSTSGQLGVTALTTGTVTSVTGTANQVAVATGTTTPVISLIGPYTPSTYTAHGVLIGEGTSSIVALGAGAAGQILQSGGASADPAYSTSTYPSTNAINTLLYASAANTISALATANSGVLTTSATGTPSITALGNRQFIATNAAGTVAARTFSTAIQVFSASGTYTPTTGMYYCQIEIVGGGGGSGGCATTNASTFASSGGGGGGEYAAGMFSATTIGSSQTVTIGTAGTGGTAGQNAGVTGGTTSVGALITAIGGTGASGSAANTSIITAGGAGGTGGTGGSIRFAGQPGGYGTGSTTAGLLLSGYGGTSRFGGGASSSIAAPNTGQAFGSGGGGGSNNLSLAARAGANGAAGYVVITEYVIN